MKFMNIVTFDRLIVRSEVPEILVVVGRYMEALVGKVLWRTLMSRARYGRQNIIAHGCNRPYSSFHDIKLEHQRIPHFSPVIRPS